jgi:hypothetical protein
MRCLFLIGRGGFWIANLAASVLPASLTGRQGRARQLSQSWMCPYNVWHLSCVLWIIWSKYPPAEPGALRFEPCCSESGDSDRSHRKSTALETTGLGPLTRTHEPHIIRPVLRVRSLRPSPYQSSRAPSLHTIPLRQVYSWKMSNCYCHSGRAGELPLH